MEYSLAIRRILVHGFSCFAIELACLRLKSKRLSRRQLWCTREHTRGTRGRYHAGDINHENEASAILESVEFSKNHAKAKGTERRGHKRWVLVAKLCHCKLEEIFKTACLIIKSLHYICVRNKTFLRNKNETRSKVVRMIYLVLRFRFLILPSVSYTYIADM